MNELKLCSKCHLSKPLEQFHLEKRNKDGHTYYCKTCAKTCSAERYAPFKAKPRIKAEGSGQFATSVYYRSFQTWRASRRSSFD